MGWLCVLTGFHCGGPLLPYPPLHSCQLQRDFRENPKRIRFGSLNHRCSFREEPVTEGNCKDTFTHITYVFTELTKLPNQLLCWALKLCVYVWACAHTCAHIAFYLTDAVFLMLEGLGTAVALSFFFHIALYFDCIFFKCLLLSMGKKAFLNIFIEELFLS